MNTNPKTLQTEFAHITGALIGAVAVFEVLYWYYFKTQGAVDLAFLNRIFAWDGVILLLLVLLIGPLCRPFTVFRKLIHTRKYLGLAAAALGFVHFLVTYIFLADRFPAATLIKNWPAPLMGLIALIIFYFLAAISNRWSLAIFGPGPWWRTQHWGVRIAFLLIYLHVLLAKKGLWIRYFDGKTDMTTPPLSLILFGAMTLVLLIRIGFLFVKYEHPGIHPAPLSNPIPLTSSPAPIQPNESTQQSISQREEVKV